MKPSNMEHSLPSSFLLMLIFFPSLIQLHKPIQAEDEKYQKCKDSFKCGNLNNLGYPFYDEENYPDYCGCPGFKLDCSNDKPEISMSYKNNDDTSGMSINTTQKFYLLDYNNASHTISLAREDYWESYCPKDQINTSINFTLFTYTSNDKNVTIYYQCSNETMVSPYQFYCPDGMYGYFAPNAPDMTWASACQRSIFIPVYKTAAATLTGNTTLHAALSSGFELEWSAENDLCDECSGSGGSCGYDPNLKKFTCYCADGPHDSSCNGAGQALTKSKIAIIASTSAVGTGILITLIVYFKSRRSKVLTVSQPRKKQEVEAFLRNYGISGPKRYTFSELKRVTNSFRDKLGAGGYGTVYRGMLHNGHQVAVKILKKSKGDPVDFINEVASIGKTNHKNIVSLLGFCYEGNKQALVYDFMPNGSLDKFIYLGNSHQSLAWEKLFQIAVGIARGLEYLHQGCNTRILHFDIKPHNILLDENFCPKISDFGLAKPCPQKKSIISMSGARGTPGYIAPEVFFRRFGGVSQKSDVYSYGMLVLEMAGCRKNSDATVECSSEQYFPHWIYKQLEENEPDHQDISTDEERELWRKMVLVSLWCIQTSPQSRPTMTRVVEMLEGTSESLQVPPIPSLASPPRSRSEQNSSTCHTISIS